MRFWQPGKIRARQTSTLRFHEAANGISVDVSERKRVPKSPEEYWHRHQYQQPRKPTTFVQMWWQLCTSSIIPTSPAEVDMQIFARQYAVSRASHKSFLAISIRPFRLCYSLSSLTFISPSQETRLSREKKRPKKFPSLTGNQFPRNIHGDITTEQL